MHIPVEAFCMYYFSSTPNWGPQMRSNTPACCVPLRGAVGGARLLGAASTELASVEQCSEINSKSLDISYLVYVSCLSSVCHLS